MRKKLVILILCIVISATNWVPVVKAIESDKIDNLDNEEINQELLDEYIQKNDMGISNEDDSISYENNTEDGLDNQIEEDSDEQELEQIDDSNVQIDQPGLEQIDDGSVQIDQPGLEQIDDGNVQIDQQEENNEFLQKNNEAIYKNENNSVADTTFESNAEEQILNVNMLSENEEFSICINVDENTINSFIKDNIYYLFIPKSADISNLVINYTGDIASIVGANFDNETKQINGSFINESELEVTLINGKEKKIKLMQSDVPAIFVNLDNGIDLESVNNNDKSIKYSGTINVKGCDNSVNNISQSGIEFKGRGNTTWAMPKRAYQIKLKSKANFLGIGSSKEKKWVLIANYQDPTLLKNKIIDDLCVNTGLSECPNADFADLYVNGNYVGNYLVCDKIEINSKRINLNNEKGVLVELDNAYYHEEEYYFRSNREEYYVIKEACSEDDITIKSAMSSFKTSLNNFEKELYSPTPSYSKISSMIDVESFAKYYLVNEFAINFDSYYSSCYMYKDGENDVIHMGPTWDYDSSFGLRKGIYENTSIDYTINYAYGNQMQRLYMFPEFAQIVNKMYEEYMKSYLNAVNVNTMANKIKYSSKINSVVWYSQDNYNQQLSKLNNFVEKRKEYFNKRYTTSQIEYSTHVEYVGWLVSKTAGISGTEGESKKIEAMMVSVGSGYGKDISVMYRAHVQDVGWQNWVSDGQIAGTQGKSLRLEAVQLKLNNSSKYSIRYRVHIENIGWTDWYYDGEVAGTEGKSLRLEAIEIQIIERKNYNNTSFINYNGHIENIGTTAYVTNGETVGTTGKALRLEGFTVALNSDLFPNINLEINEHIQNKGWIYGMSDGQYIGTRGQGLRLEAFTIKIKGKDANKYAIKYRAHVQNIGWQEWVSDGQIAGTEGQSLRIEAIEIIIVKK